MCACVSAKSLQSCPTLCDSMDCRLPGFSVRGILQARILECVAMPSSRESFQPRIQPASLLSPTLSGGFFTISATWEAQLLSHFWLFETPWTKIHQTPMSMEFSKQEYWSGVPFPSPRDLSNLRVKPTSLASSALEGGFFTTVPPEKLIVSNKWK